MYIHIPHAHLRKVKCFYGLFHSMGQRHTWPGEELEIVMRHWKVDLEMNGGIRRVDKMSNEEEMKGMLEKIKE